MWYEMSSRLPYSKSFFLVIKWLWSVVSLCQCRGCGGCLPTFWVHEKQVWNRIIEYKNPTLNDDENLKALVGVWKLFRIFYFVFLTVG